MLTVVPSSAAFLTLDFNRKFDTSSVFPGYTKPASGFDTLDSVPYYLGDGVNDAWHADSASGSNPRTLQLQPNQSGLRSVYVLINTYWGEKVPGTFASITFERQGGASWTLDLDGNVHIRDFYQNVFTNNVDPNWTKAVWEDDVRRMDRLKVDLPAEFLLDTLTGITFSDNGGGGFQRIFVSGVTLETADSSGVPEPGTYATLGAGLLFLGWYRRRTS